MQKYINSIKNIMATYYKTTKIGSLCFDTNLNLVAALPENLNIQEFAILGFGKLLSFLAETFAHAEVSDKYFTCFLNHNLVCHIVFLSIGENYIGAIITDPVLLGSMSLQEAKDFSIKLDIPSLDEKKLEKIFSRKTTVPYEQALALGTVIYSLCQSFLKENTSVQILKNFEDLANLPDRTSIEGQSKWNDGLERHTPSEVYMRIKHAIQDGDINTITEILNEQSAANAPMHQLHKTDHIRSIKNSFIKLCSMACYTAIDAGAPYVQTLDMADSMIVKMESLKSITELYDLMRIVLIEFTNTVSRNKKIGFSHPVRKCMDYLYNHYNEKVTLNDLSRYTNFSLSYLSNLIKLETGLSLNDNLNKIRIEQSQKLLSESNISILEVAQNVGFNYQNHFASVFKKYTGITPTEYRNIQGIKQNQQQVVSESAGGDTIQTAIQQLKIRLNLFTGLYDNVRVVDPVEHKSWLVYGEDVSTQHLVCYEFWNRNEACHNCISIRAYVQNDTIFKLEQKRKSTFLVLAFPLNIGKTIYIAELIKDITKQSIIMVKSDKACDSVEECCRELWKGLYSRYHVDKQLPLELRKSKTEQRKLTLMAITHSQAAEDNYETNSRVNSILAEASLPCLPLEEDWIGCYTGNLLLYVLHDCTSEQVEHIFDNIQDNFISKLNALGFASVTLQYAEQEMKQEISETGELLYLLLAKLHRKVQPEL